jgi:hypothetical protein
LTFPPFSAASQQSSGFSCSHLSYSLSTHFYERTDTGLSLVGNPFSRTLLIFNCGLMKCLQKRVTLLTVRVVVSKDRLRATDIISAEVAVLFLVFLILLGAILCIMWVFFFRKK